MAMLNNQRVKTIYSKTIFLPGDFPCSSCSPGTVSLEDTEALRQELGFALVCARRFEEAIGVLGQVAPGGFGALGPLGLGCGGPRHEENHGEFGGDSKVSRKLKDLKGKSWRIDLLEILMGSCKTSLGKSPAKVGGWEVGGGAGDGFDGFVRKGDYSTYIYLYQFKWGTWFSKIIEFGIAHFFEKLRG